MRHDAAGQHYLLTCNSVLQTVHVQEACNTYDNGDILYHMHGPDLLEVHHMHTTTLTDMLHCCTR